MKLTKGILGCALAAGLMTFAADKTQAGGIVIGNDFYTPLNVKLTTTYNDSGKLKKETTTSKAILNALGYKNSTLALGDFGDVYVINTKTKEVTTDLTEDGLMIASFTNTVDTDQEKNNGSYTYNGVGVLELQFDSEGGLNVDDGVVAKTLSLNGDYSFDISGVYSEKYSESADDKNDNYNVKDKISAPQLSGSGFDSDLSEDILPVTGNAKFSGSGKLSDE